ncbi:sphingoid long-chain bases kinase 1-like [Canna indica]|uniref:Sphingoid long-chain bases kinase 1-like n=1 Tax=Canna indica TaxID=4628 RepID=A0AAQ3QDN0_9LILI|nr:sphingoid long-chain bases kinase 1-like [Canna indica]
MQDSANHHQNVTSPRGSLQQSLRRLSGKKTQTAKGQHSSPTVFPEKKGKVKSLKKSDASVANEGPDKVKPSEHRIDIGDENSDLLGYEVFSGKLSLDKKAKSERANEQTGSGTGEPNKIEAKLTSKALIWGSNILNIDDIVAVSYHEGLRHFTIHAYPTKRRSCFMNPQRVQKDFRFLASSSKEAVQWVQGFADQQCSINCLPHPMMSSKKQESDVGDEPLFDFDIPYIKCRSPPSILVILNPRSGHGRSSKLFHGKVEPIFKLAGFKMEIFKTTYAGHARNLASTVDFSTCPDGIVCVGGDGIVNEVLNGLLSRENQKEAISMPIGVIPAGSDNSLVWTVLGVRDPISAAMAIVKGGLTATDVLTVKWIQNGISSITHFGTTVSYFGFLSDVLELSEKYQKNFGPLRYFVAGFLKFLCLPKYSFDVEYLPKTKVVNSEEKSLVDQQKVDMSDLYTDIMRRSRKEGLTRASSLSSIDSIMTPGRDFDTTGSTVASSEPSEYVRALDPKVKRLSLGRNNLVTEPDEVLHPQPHLSSNPNWPRTRSKSRTDRTWTGLTATNDARGSWAATSLYDKEDISSTVSDPGPIWDAEPKWHSEPKWDTEPTWENEKPIELPEPPDDIELGMDNELVPSLEEKWVVKKGKFLAVLVCNHSCKTVQSLSSQVVAPKAEHDDNSLDLLLINGSGRMRLLRFFMYLQFGRHLSLPYVDYVKVKSVKIKPAAKTNNGCGIDGELLRVDGQAFCSLLPEQCRLIGHPVKNGA